MPTTPKLRPRSQKLRPLERGGRKNSKADYAGGFCNREVAVAWSCCPGRVSKKWEPFCTALLAVYRAMGRQRLQQWLAEISSQSSSIRNQQSAICTVSHGELGLIWQRSAGFVREHKRPPFERNMAALHELDDAGLWLLIAELDFRERLRK